MRRAVIMAAMLGASAALGGCTPAIDAYRNLRGLARDDPPASAPNTKNFRRAEAEPYPNLAGVPAPPAGGSTAAERARMLRKLTTGRADLAALDSRLRAGARLALAPPPAPPELPPGTGGNPPAPAGAKPALIGPGPRKAGRPPLPGPRESPLVSPRIAALPQPEAARRAPPPPQLAPLPAPAPAALPSLARAEAGVRPPPPPPRLAPPPPPPPPPAPPPPPLPAGPPLGSGPPPARSAATRLAEIDFPAPAGGLASGERATLARIAARYRAGPGTLRIVGFAGAGGGARRQLRNFRAALDRAQAVAEALKEAGMPAARLRVEAAPAGADRGAARAEILLEP